MTTAREPIISLLEDYAILICQKEKSTNNQTKNHKQHHHTKHHPLQNRHLQKQISPVLPEAEHELDSFVTVRTVFWLEGYLVHLIY